MGIGGHTETTSIRFLAVAALRNPRTTPKEVEEMMNNLINTQVPGSAKGGTLPVYENTGGVSCIAVLRAHHPSHLLVVGSR